jgi:hypothetical protein
LGNVVKIKVDPEAVGQAFANSDDSEQAAMINNMGRLLFMLCGGGTEMDTQLCYVADKLDTAGRRLIDRIATFNELRDKSSL